MALASWSHNYSCGQRYSWMLRSEGGQKDLARRSAIHKDKIKTARPTIDQSPPKYWKTFRRTRKGGKFDLIDKSQNSRSRQIVESQLHSIYDPSAAELIDLTHNFGMNPSHATEGPAAYRGGGWTTPQENYADPPKTISHIPPGIVADELPPACRSSPAAYAAYAALKYIPLPGTRQLQQDHLQQQSQQLSEHQFQNRPHSAGYAAGSAAYFRANRPASAPLYRGPPHGPPKLPASFFPASPTPSSPPMGTPARRGVPSPSGPYQSILDIRRSRAYNEFVSALSQVPPTEAWGVLEGALQDASQVRAVGGSGEGADLARALYADPAISHHQNQRHQRPLSPDDI